MWYCAHAVLFLQEREGEQKEFVVWEHLYLIEATSPQEAFAKATIRAKQDESNDPSFTLNDRPVDLRFGCIRKVVECQDFDEQGRPTDGTELSYTELIVESPQEFTKLVGGESAQVIYNEIYDD